MSAADDTPVSAAEAAALFDKHSDAPVLLLAVSGGPDSTALLFLAARWRKARKRAPKLVAVTVDHGLRPEAKAEANAVRKLARSLGVEHRILRWSGRKPSAGLQDAARRARYRLLAKAARKAGARDVMTAHTFDDQAETVLIRLMRGSGLMGLAAMVSPAPYPLVDTRGLRLVRPLLGVRKARLVATLKTARIPFADDPSNADPRFTRARLRALMPALAREGLTADRLERLARRAGRGEAALSAAVEEAAARLAPPPWPARGPVSLDARAYGRLPEEVALRLLGRLIDQVGDEGPVELGKLEAFHDALSRSPDAETRNRPGFARFRRTLAGAMVTLDGGWLRVERAPPRRASKRP